MPNGSRIRDLMHREFVGVSESDPLDDAAELMLEESADCLVVLRGGEPVGSLSPRNALAAVLSGSDPEETTVGTVMQRPAPTVEADDPVTVAEDRLVAEGSGRLVVTAAGDAVGVITRRDVLAATSTRSVPDTEVDTEVDDSITQSICEVCGSLTAELTSSNGQLVCPNCQDV